jgi:LacI family transcriptional regulator
MLDAAKRLGLAVPTDVQVIGYNDPEASSSSIFDLSAVRRSLSGMAPTASHLLLARIDGAAGRPVHQNFGVELIQCGATTALVTGL